MSFNLLFSRKVTFIQDTDSTASAHHVMEAIGLAISLAGLSPLASKFAKLSRFLYEAARDKGEIRGEIEQFALNIKLAGNSLFLTLETLKALSPSVQSSKTCRYLTEERVVQGINRAIRDVEKRAATIFPELRGIKKDRSLWSKFRWLATQKQRLFDLQQSTLPLQTSLGLIMAVIKLERDCSDMALTQDPIYSNRLGEEM